MAYGNQTIVLLWLLCHVTPVTSRDVIGVTWQMTSRDPERSSQLC